MERRNRNQPLGKNVSPKNIVVKMLSLKENLWLLVSSAIVKTQKKLVQKVTKRELKGREARVSKGLDRPGWSLVGVNPTRAQSKSMFAWLGWSGRVFFSFYTSVYEQQQKISTSVENGEGN